MSAQALEGKVAVITGGAGGIGSATARLFVERGAQVIVTDVRRAGLDAIMGDLGSGHASHEHDVSSVEDWQRIRTAVREQYGRIDILVNNAAITKPATVLDVDLADWQQIINVDQTGVLLGMKTFGLVMAEQRSGSIINFSSYAGLQGNGSSIAYTAAKWAVRGMTRFAAREFAPYGVRVNAVLPGIVDTPILASANQEVIGAAKLTIPLGRLGATGDLASLVAFLASDESQFITGADHMIDGGLSA